MDYEYTSRQAFELQIMLSKFDENDAIFRWAFKHKLYDICTASMLNGVDYSNLDTKNMAQRAMRDGQIGIASVLQVADKFIWN